MVVLCYLIGSISPGIIISKLKGKGDIREHGSGGTGATNVNRTLGTKYGILVLMLDCLKAIIPLLIIKYLMYITSFFSISSDIMDMSSSLMPAPHPIDIYFPALAVMLGHIFPIWHKFKGGKGVAVALGVLFVINWQFTLIILAVFLLIVIVFRYISLGSIAAAVSFPLLNLMTKDRDLIIFSCVLALIVIWTHKQNILRLLEGKENKFSFKKS